MHDTQVAIVGGGLAGSLAAAMLGRDGVDVVFIDPNKQYPAEFRCEKLDGDQMAILRRTGLADAVLTNSTHDREAWVARYGRIVEKRPGDQQGIFYASLVNTVRAEIPTNVRHIAAKATGITTSVDRQTVTLSNGEEVRARLVILANGLSLSLRDALKLGRETVSKCHSISIGFNMKPLGREAFPFPALTYYSETPANRAALITMFPIGEAMRANLFVYRDMDDPWLKAFRTAPKETLLAMMPSLAGLAGDFAVDGFAQIRPVDLYVSTGHEQDGIVLVGDAFSTSCPAAGTGARKALNDVERLCNHYVRAWLETPGMGRQKVAQFYADPVKRACDDFAKDKAFQLKSFSLDPSLTWNLRRWGKFFAQSGRWALREAMKNEVAPARKARVLAGDEQPSLN
jgi:2-polyprenyl-6-methoxyphenol hydroxylase-like FAD-dependent oxidoreductase